MARPVRLHLSWRRNGDNLDVALAVNRLLAHNHPVWWCLKLAGTVEAGDYLLEGPSGLAERLSALNVSTVRWSGRSASWRSAARAATGFPPPEGFFYPCWVPAAAARQRPSGSSPASNSLSRGTFSSGMSA